MHPTKALVPMLHLLYISKILDIVGKDVVNFCFENLNSEKGLEYIIHTNTVLIPKVNDPNSITQFRPISLCNVIYKIIERLLLIGLSMFFPIALVNLRVRLYQIC